MRDRLALSVCQEVEADSTVALEEWIDTVSRSDRNALESHLMALDAACD